MQKKVVQFLVYLSLFAVVQGQPVLNGSQSGSANGKTTRLARTTGTLPFFEYGPGDDRLGGAKMTYMDTGVLVKVIDSLNNDYIIELANNLKAFVAKPSLRFDSTFKLRPYYLSGNWKTYSDDRFDYITISMPERLPYRGTMQVNPNRLAIDLFGITSNTNWITQKGMLSEARNTWFEQLENGVLRVYVDLKSKMHWGYTVYYDSIGSRLTIRIKHAPDKKIKNVFIAVDAGHGGDNSGAAGRTSSKLEKTLTLEYASALEKELKKAGIKRVFMTRTSDTSLSMPERIKMLRDTAPDLLISIHFNSSSVDTVRGTSTFYRHIGFRPLTQTILKRMMELGLNEFGNVGSFNFALSGPTDYPNCLVEVAFLSNLSDEKFILSKKSPANVARKIRLGIQDWLQEAR
jgi:N-acetylmuramoyl-L-alanine amidase